MSDSSNAETRRIVIDIDIDGALRIDIAGHLEVMSPEDARAFASAIYEAANMAEGVRRDHPNWFRRFMQYLILDIKTHSEAVREGTPSRTGRAHCWVKDQTQTNAFHIAVGWLADDDWVVASVIEHRDVTRDSFLESPLSRYYDQALTDEQVFFYDLDEKP